MIKSIVFDVGGVLIDESDSKSREILAKKFGFKSEDFKSFVKKNLARSHKGLNYRDFFSEFVKEYGITTSVEELAEAWLEARNKTSKINKKVRRLVYLLRKRYFVVSLTNTTILNDKARTRQEIYKMFKVNILSTKVKMMKPEKEIYELLLNKLKESGINKDEILFIDDEQKNVDEAKKLGIQSILFVDYNKLMEDLIKMGVKR